jgi:hypothetical protein
MKMHGTVALDGYLAVRGILHLLNSYRREVLCESFLLILYFSLRALNLYLGKGKLIERQMNW